MIPIAFTAHVADLEMEENTNAKRSIHNKPAVEEYIINGCKVRLYYAEKDNKEVPDIMKMIEKSLLKNYILAS